MYATLYKICMDDVVDVEIANVVRLYANGGAVMRLNMWVFLPIKNIVR